MFFKKYVKIYMYVGLFQDSQYPGVEFFIPCQYYSILSVFNNCSLSIHGDECSIFQTIYLSSFVQNSTSENCTCTVLFGP
jgi:hypothetical protein